LSGIQRKPMNWFLWAAVAAAAAGIVLFTALGIDASRGPHTNDRRGAVGATLLAVCVGVATVLAIIGLVVKFS
jgi:membrane protein DedA with SNARE-associated domain